MSQPTPKATESRPGFLSRLILFGLFGLLLPFLSLFFLAAVAAPYWSTWTELVGESFGFWSVVILLGVVVLVLPLLLARALFKKTKLKRAPWLAVVGVTNILILGGLVAAPVDLSGALKTHGTWFPSKALGREHRSVEVMQRHLRWNAGEAPAIGTAPSTEVPPKVLNELPILIAGDEREKLTEIIGQNPQLKGYYRDPRINWVIEKAFRWRNFRFLRELKESGYPFGVGPKGGPVSWAMDSEDARGEKILVLQELGATLECVDEDGNTPLHQAAATGPYLSPLGDYLLLNGLDIDAQNKNGRTPLHLAVERGDIKAVATLLVRGADPTIVDAAGRTPLDLLHHMASSEYKGSTLYANLEKKEAILADLEEFLRRNEPEWTYLFEDKHGKWEIDTRSGQIYYKDHYAFAVRASKDSADPFPSVIHLRKGNLYIYNSQPIKDKDAYDLVSRLASQLPEQNVFLVEPRKLPKHWSEEDWRRELGYQVQWKEEEATALRVEPTPSPVATKVPDKEPVKTPTPTPDLPKVEAVQEKPGLTNLEIRRAPSDEARTRFPRALPELYVQAEQKGLDDETFTCTMRHNWFGDVHRSFELEPSGSKVSWKIPSPEEGWIPGPYTVSVVTVGFTCLKTVWLEKDGYFAFLTDFELSPAVLTLGKEQVLSATFKSRLLEGPLEYEIAAYVAPGLRHDEVVEQGTIKFEKEQTGFELKLKDPLPVGEFRFRLSQTGKLLRNTKVTVRGEHGMEFTPAMRRASMNIVDNQLAKLKQEVQKEPGLIHLRDSNGETLLHLAASRGRLEMVKYLLEQGSDINSPQLSGHPSNHGMTPLFDAVIFDKSKVFDYLLESGADFKHRSYTGFTPLFMAVDRNKLKFAKRLLEKGAEMSVTTQDPRKKTLAHVAGPEMLEFLFEKGFVLQPTERFEYTPLHHSAKNAAAIKLLCRQGADTEVREPEGGRTPVFYVSRDLESLAAFRTMGADLNSQNFEGDTMLHIAARSDLLEVTQWLVENGADRTLLNIQGKTPLECATPDGDSYKFLAELP